MALDEMGVAATGADEFELVAVDVSGQRIYLSARQAPSADEASGRTRPDGEEQEISARWTGRPRLEHLLDGLAGFAQEIAGRLQGTNASKVSVEFGCEVMVESGQFVAVIGKASSKSTITVGLEWDKPTP
ncbi:CU044_2847 family protein [Streptomyces sp. NPDC001178]